MTDINPVLDQPQPTPESIPQETTEVLKEAPPDKKPKNWLLIISIVLFLIALGAAGSFAYWQYQLGQQFSQKPQPTPSPAQTPAPTITPTPSGPKESELTSLDETWNKYTNYQLGFSIKVPKEMLQRYGSCKWDEEGGDHSYRADPALVPVKIYEDTQNSTVYITSEYYYELAGETIENYVSYYSECNKVPNSLERVRREYRAERGHYQQTWNIIVKEVANDSQLGSFIKERYGSGCTLGQKTPSEQEGVFNVRIEGTIETGCIVNYITVLRYFPAKNKVVSWHLGQDITFYKGLGTEDIIYDLEMTESFRFLE